MYQIFRLLCFVVLLSALAVSAAGRKGELGNEPDLTVWSFSEDKDGDIWVEVSHLFIEEPSFHLELARNRFLEEDYEESAYSIRKAAAYLGLHSDYTKGEYKKDLKTYAKDLLVIAKQVEKGKVKSVKEMDTLFGKVYTSLAGYAKEKSKQSWTKKAVRKTGHEMHAAITYMEKSAKASGRKIKDKTKAVMKKAKAAASKMKKGEKAKTEDVEKAMEEEYWGTY
ncbi:hypothetical protein ACFL5V_09335 [Fibrobacterota bacterium]